MTKKTTGGLVALALAAGLAAAPAAATITFESLTHGDIFYDHADLVWTNFYALDPWEGFGNPGTNGF